MPQRTAPEPPPPASVGTPPSGTPAPASPGVRRLAREIGVDINTVMGSGPGGRISQEDVKEHARRILSSVGSSGAAALTAGRPAPPGRCPTSPSGGRSRASRGPTSAA